MPKFTVMRVLQRHAAAWPHLRFVTWRKLDRDAGGNALRDARRKHHAFHGAQIQTGVFLGAMGVSGRTASACRRLIGILMLTG